MKIFIRLMGYGISPIGIRSELELSEGTTVEDAIDLFLKREDPDGKYSDFSPAVILLNDSISKKNATLKDGDLLVCINMLAGG